MIHGLDTGFLVAAEVTKHGEHTGARATLARLLAAGDLIAIAPQVLVEFIHIVTDPRRFIQPLDMTMARQLAEQWWTAREGIHSGCENLSLVVTPLSAVPCRHGHTSGIIIRPLGADPTRSAGLYSGA